MLDGAVEVLMSQPIRPIVLQTPSSACSFGLSQRRHQKQVAPILFSARYEKFRADVKLHNAQLFFNVVQRLAHHLHPKSMSAATLLRNSLRANLDAARLAAGSTRIGFIKKVDIINPKLCGAFPPHRVCVANCPR
jgi:hypothetical protein